MSTKRAVGERMETSHAQRTAADVSTTRLREPPRLRSERWLDMTALLLGIHTPSCAFGLHGAIHVKRLRRYLCSQSELTYLSSSLRLLYFATRKSSPSKTPQTVEYR